MIERIDDPSGDRPIASSAFPEPQRRPLRMLLLGDREDVLETIKNLHQRGFAPAGEWSRAIACPAANELLHPVGLNLPADSVISILTKYLS